VLKKLKKKFSLRVGRNNNVNCHPPRNEMEAGDPLNNSQSLNNSNANNIVTGGFPNSNKYESENDKIDVVFELLNLKTTSKNITYTINT
jgi:hypothetical protein